MMEKVLFEPYSVSLSFISLTAQDEETWVSVLRQFIDLLALATTDTGSSVIGHIKGFAQSSEVGFVKISCISADHPADIKGQLEGKTISLTLLLNVLVYGHTCTELAKLTRQAMDAVSRQWSVSIEIMPSNGRLFQTSISTFKNN